MAKVNIKGVIVSNDDKWIYDFFGIASTSPGSVAEEIAAANGSDLEVEINSGGGNVFAGSEIYTALKSYAGNVTVRIVGLAASAASVVAMAGKRTLMSPTAQMMLHNVSSSQDGDHRDMQHMADVLKGADISIANAYRLKSGMPEKDLLDMMGKETWLTPQQALEHKLIDEIMFATEEVKLAASWCSMLPPEVISKMRSSHPEKARGGETERGTAALQKVQAQQNFLKLKGATR